MELPFLKKKNQGGGGPPIEITREGNSDAKLLEMVADELIEAFHAKNKASLLEALRAFIQLIKDQDTD